MPEEPNAREGILRAAERLVVDEGVKHLTIERVAIAAGVSRGGVLYHFRSKEELIKGMLLRFVEHLQAALDRAVAGDSEPGGRFTRAYARLILERDPALGALLAGLAYDPSLLAPLHERLAQWQRQSEAELDPTTAAIVRLTTHALWTNGLFLTNSFDAGQLGAIVARLEELTRAA